LIFQRVKSSIQDKLKPKKVAIEKLMNDLCNYEAFKSGEVKVAVKEGTKLV
jgi:hypothetical protein